MARTELVKFRVTPAEKAFLVTRAGGARQLSGHLRELALQGFSDTGSSEGVSTPRSPAEDSQDEGGGQQADTSEAVELLPVAQPSAQTGLPTLASTSAEKCPRWMHHRTGTYCGSCKKVPK